MRNTLDCKQTVSPLFFLTFSVPCWFFGHASFLQNPKPKNLGKYHVMHLRKYVYSSHFDPMILLYYDVTISLNEKCDFHSFPPVYIKVALLGIPEPPGAI